MINITKNEKINVCDKCFRACCCRGYFMCSEAKEAGTIEIENNNLTAWNLGDLSHITKEMKE